MEQEQPATAPRILVADDQSDIREALRLLTKAEKMDAEIVSSPAAALDALQVADFDVALIDLNYTRDTTSGHEGLDLLSAIRNVDSDLPVIVMTAWANVDLAVQAMLRGARDFSRDMERAIPRINVQPQTGVDPARAHS